MYAPHASPGRLRLAEFARTPTELTDPTSGRELSAADLTAPPADAMFALPVAGALVAIVAFLVAYRLLRAHPVGVLFALPSRAVHVAGRSTAWFGVGSAMVGLTALSLLRGGWPSTTVTVGSVAAGAAFLAALLPLRGVGPGAVRRAARALDGVLVGLALMFCGWVLVIAPHGGAGSITFWVVMFHCCLIANAAVAGIAASPRAAQLRVPVLAVPVTLALLLALARLAMGAQIDRGAALIGVLAAVAVGLRRLLPERAVTAGSPVPPAPVTAQPRTSGLTAAIMALGDTQGQRGALLAVGSSGPVRGEELARRLRDLVGDEGTVAGIGGDVAVLTTVNVLHAYGLAHDLVTALGPEAGGASVGLTDLAVEPTRTVASADEVMRRAVVALRRAEQLGPGRVEWYDASVEEACRRTQAIEQALPRALRHGELNLIYQPIVDLARGRPSAVEALLRWRHPTLGTLMPGEFIPVAVRTGAITDLGHWVFRQATTQLASWRRSGRDLSMAVNVTPDELVGLSRELGPMLAAQHVPADRLVLEIAESRIQDGAALAEHTGLLRSAGVRTALDAFGAEPASLAHLRRLPIDMVKIGQSFFGGTPTVPRPRRAPEQAPLVDLLVGVGRRLGVDVVAHGLEAPAQLEVARTAGCRMGQGHLFARPQPAEHTEAYLDGFR